MFINGLSLNVHWGPIMHWAGARHTSSRGLSSFLPSFSPSFPPFFSSFLFFFQLLLLSLLTLIPIVLVKFFSDTNNRNWLWFHWVKSELIGRLCGLIGASESLEDHTSNRLEQGWLQRARKSAYFLERTVAETRLPGADMATPGLDALLPTTITTAINKF